ncbi:hypothetical protein SOPP22_17425 [Shewanella sp. OPT22]|nr:hypothetical protein SOPP22_17425 [Shewanella sp. OPT22]
MLLLVHDGNCTHKLDLNSIECHKLEHSNEKPSISCFIANKEWCCFAEKLKETGGLQLLKNKIEAFLSLQSSTHSDSNMQCVLFVNEASGSVSYKIFRHQDCADVFIEQTYSDERAPELAKRILKDFQLENVKKSVRKINNLKLSEFDLSNVQFRQLQSMKNISAEKQSFGHVSVSDSSVEKLILTKCSAKDFKVLKSTISESEWIRLTPRTFYSENSLFYKVNLSKVSCLDFTVLTPEWIEVSLESAMLTHIIIDGRDSQCTITKCCFDSALMSNFTFNALKLTKTSANNSTYVNGRFTDIEWENSNVVDAKFSKCSFENVQFRDIDFSGATFVGCNQVNLQFERCKFNGVKCGLFQDMALNSVKLNNVEFENLDLSEVNFEGAELENVIFKNCKLDKCSFKNCDMESVYFDNTKLDDVEFTGVKNLKLESFNNTDCKLITSEDSSLDKFFSANFESIVIEPLRENFEVEPTPNGPSVPPRSSVSFKLSSDMKSRGTREDDGRPKQPNLILQRARTKLVNSSDDIDYELSLYEMIKYEPIRIRERSKQVSDADRSIISHVR